MSCFAGSDSLIYSLNGSLFTPYHLAASFILSIIFISKVFLDLFICCFVSQRIGHQGHRCHAFFPISLYRIIYKFHPFYTDEDFFILIQLHLSILFFSIFFSTVALNYLTYNSIQYSIKPPGLNSRKIKKEAGQISPADSISSTLQQFQYLIRELPLDLHMLRIIHQNLFNQRIHSFLIKLRCPGEAFHAFSGTLPYPDCPP